MTINKISNKLKEIKQREKHLKALKALFKSYTTYLDVSRKTKIDDDIYLLMGSFDDDIYDNLETEIRSKESSLLEDIANLTID